MALSNILNEPRREITESVVGIGVVSAGIALDYWFASWFWNVTKDSAGGPCPIALGMFFGLVVALGIVIVPVLFMVATHAVGDAICNALDRRGIYLRPRNRR